ncbi:histidine kinase [Microbacterium sp. NPDC089318]
MPPSNRSAEPGARRALFAGATAAIVIGGFFFDVAALPNVPGASMLDDVGEIRITHLGTSLIFVVLIAWTTVIWRRRAPLVALVAGALLASIGVSYVLLLVSAFATAQRYPDRVRRLGALGAGLIAVFVLREATTPWGGALPWYFTSRIDAQFESAWIFASFVWAMVSSGMTAGFVLLARTRAKARQNAVRAEREHHRADVLSEQMVRQAERERIARDMHDALAHRLSVVSLHAGALEAVASAGADSDGVGDARQIARTVREQTHAALQDMRGLIGDLRSGTPAGPSSPASMRAIGGLLMQLRTAGSDIRPYVVIDSAERASTLLDGAVFRVVQEALTNAIKHAPGAPIDLFVQVEPTSGARIRISNPLTAHDVSTVPGGSNGLLGVRERAAALGGDAWLGVHDGAFIVDVCLPWHERGEPSLSSGRDPR